MHVESAAAPRINRLLGTVSSRATSAPRQIEGVRVCVCVYACVFIYLRRWWCYGSDDYDEGDEDEDAGDAVTVIEGSINESGSIRGRDSGMRMLVLGLVV